MGYAMNVADVTLAARGQIVIPKEARDALGLKPGARLSVRVEGGRLVMEKRVTLNLGRWVGKAVNDGLTTEAALSELRGRSVPWQGGDDTPASQTTPPKRPAIKHPASQRKSTAATGKRKSPRA
jgi:AbrB family looped-hinge helix DNA binding protein